MIVSEQTLSYLAGAIDADGFITIHRQAISRVNPDKRNGRRTDYYTGIIGLQQVRPEVVELLAQTFGGSARTCRYGTRPRNRPTYVWSLSNRMARDACMKLLPFLILKRENAEIILEFQAGIDHRGSRIADEERNRRERLYRKVTALNTPRSRPAAWTLEKGGE